MFRKIRIAVALCFWVGMTTLFLDFTGSVHAFLGWMARVQFVPAVLAVNAAVVLALVVLTLLCGRVYCSWICPLGITQDAVSWLRGRVQKKARRRFGFRRPLSWLRYGVLMLFLATLLAGLTQISALLDPYGIFGRGAQSLLQPLYVGINNLLAAAAERADSYAFYRVDVWVRSGAVLGISAAMWTLIIIMAWRGGRTYCNTICPVGTLLGVLGRFALLRPRIDISKCNGCKACARQCKASCINADTHEVDMTRCVMCGDCEGACKQGALRLRFRNEGPRLKDEECSNTARRDFLTVAGLTLSAVAHAQSKQTDGGLAAIEDKVVPPRTVPVLSPGAVSQKHFHQHCTACQLCVAACPNGVLRPSDEWALAMQPVMAFERGYCRPECMRCADVCPTSAIRLTDLAEKTAVHAGHAVWIKENCLAWRYDAHCGNCARHCPVGAITMVKKGGDEEAAEIPVVDATRCIGCGACEHLCPARPLHAIYVEGNEVQIVE